MSGSGVVTPNISRATTPSDFSDSFSGSEIGGTFTAYHPVRVSAEKPSLLAGYVVLVLSILLLVLGGWAIFFSAFWPLSGIPVLGALSKDTHYKYFMILLVPTTAYFVIANWVGWQYYRNS